MEERAYEDGKLVLTLVVELVSFAPGP